MRMTEAEYQSLQDRRKALTNIALSHGLPGPKKSKYRNQKVTVDGILFHSKREASRWQQLKIMEQAGAIEDLKRQQSFILAPAVQMYGKRHSALKYTCDFLYYEKGELVVEDLKSPASKDTAYIMRRHLMMHVHNIEIRETA